MDKKYISYLINDEEYIFTFNVGSIHKDMDLDIRLDLWDRDITAIKLGAGFITKTEMCYGFSDSMNLNSRGIVDTKILNSRYHSYVEKEHKSIKLPIALNEYLLYRKEQS